MNTRLATEIDAGRALLPGVGVNFVDLMRAIGTLTGVPDVDASPESAALATQIGAHEHIVFVLADGLGMALLEKLPADSFLRQHLARELRAVFPATTACALTSMATGLWPGEHGMPGWWSYLAESGLSVTSLPFIERFTHAPLPTLGVKTEDLWPCPVLMSRMTHEPLLLQPEEFWDSSFSRYIRGGRAGAGYRKIPDVIGRIATRIATATSPTYTMLYITDPDHSAHTFGVSSEHTMAALRQLDYHLAELATAINGTARLIITADHGLVDVTEKNRLGLFAGDPLLELLVAPPSGDSRVAHFHVKPGNETTFTAQFIARFGEVMLLLTQQELEESSLLGPCALSPLAKSRFGDFIGIALHPISFRYYRTVKDTENEEIGRHSGFSPAEMRIPLILA